MDHGLFVWETEEGLGALRATPTHSPAPALPPSTGGWVPLCSALWPCPDPSLLLSPADVGSVEGLAYHRGWDTLYWTSYTTSTITRHTVDQTRPGAFERETVITMSGDDHPRAFVLDECQK